jgi:hypothetical protein
MAVRQLSDEQGPAFAADIVGCACQRSRAPKANGPRLSFSAMSGDPEK